MFGRRRGYRRGFGGGGGGLGLMLLAMQLLHLFQFLSNSNEYYPISLGVLGLNLLAYFQPGRNWPSLQQACISVRGAWFDRQWKRVFLASFYHTSDFHLYYNMASFVWKAISLERHYGSGYFLYMVSIFSVTTNLVYLAMNYALAEITNQWSYINSCAAGFSGVLFALKVVTTHIQPAGMTRVMGFIPVPMRLACWVELVLISVLFPHVSFVGHLAGILVGFAFVYGPLRVIMDIPLSVITGTTRSLVSVDLDGVLPDLYRRIAIVLVGLFMILFPILVDLVPNDPGTGQHNTVGRSYTYRAGTTGQRAAQGQGRRTHPPPQQPTTQYHSYTYAARASGRGGETEEDPELQEAIRRSLSSSSQSGQGQEREREGEEREREGQERERKGEEREREREEREREGEESSEDIQEGIERSIRSPGADDHPHSTPPSPYNPNFPPGVGGGNSTAEPHSDVGWNTDLLESNEDRQDSTSRPLGFDAVTDSVSTRASGNGGTEIRQRRNQTRDDSGGGSLTREAVREVRLQRLGGGGGGGEEGERRPLSELSKHSFSFRKS